jgi:pimeloyl-ACP methyl ester carboxylesterase
MTAVRTIQTHRYSIEVGEQGAGEPPLVFLHGWERPWHEAPFLEALARTRRVITPVHPGFGESTRDIASNDMHNAVVFYQELIDVLGLEKFDLAGHSLGAMFAAELAVVSRERVRKLVLVDALGLWDDAAPVPDFMGMAGRRLQALLWADTDNGPLLLPPLSQDPTEANVLRTANLAAAGHYLWPIPDRGLSARLHRIKAPTLLVWGEKDGVVPPVYGKHFQAAIAGSQLEILAEAGHFPNIEQPERFVSVVEDFLAG